MYVNLLLRALVILIISIPTSTYAQSQPVRELAPGVFYYYGDEKQQKSANCTWIVFNDYVLAVDANYPWGAEEILKEIRKTTAKPVRFVFNTHYHHDHTFGNSVFSKQGATILSTNKTAEEMRTLGEVEWKNNSAYSGRNMSGYERTFPSLTFSDSLIFDDGEHRVILRKMGPAHTAGDGIVYLPKENILVTGDLFVHDIPWGNNVADANADYDRWLLVLDTLASWNPKLIIPGHGTPKSVKEIKQQRAYLSDMLEQVRNGISAGKSKEELVQSVKLDKHPVYGQNYVSTKRSVAAMYDNLSRQRK